MSNNYFRFLWLKLNFHSKKHFSISIPIPLFILDELLDCILDFLTVLNLFTTKKSNSNQYKPNAFYNVKEILLMIIQLIHSLTIDEPYDLVDVRTDQVMITIKIGKFS